MKASSWFSKMLGMSMRLENLDELLVLQLQDLYSAEDQLLDALPKLQDRAHNQQLKSAFGAHCVETKRQKLRLEQCFRALGRQPVMADCEAMRQLIQEGEQVMSLDGDPDVKDAALIAAAQRVEHYEIAGYGCVRTFARRLGRNDVAALLEQSLEEESHADTILSEIAEAAVNVAAARL